MTAKWLAVAATLAFAGGAQAHQYDRSCGPERVIDALAEAVIRVAPLFVKPKSQPVSQAAPPQEAHPLGITREEVEAAVLDWCADNPNASLCVKLRSAPR